MRYSLSSLRVFSVVAEVGSITEAAERLGKTPSTISAALKSFEEEIGVPLFETERKNRLSKAGQFARVHAQDVLLHYDRAVAAMRAFGRNQIGRIVFACVPSVATAILPRVVLEFRDRYPGVEIEVHDMDSPSVVEAVVSGKVEFGLASMRRVRSDLWFRPLFKEALGIVCRNDDPLTGLARDAEWNDLKGRSVLANGISSYIPSLDMGELSAAVPITVYNVLSLIALVKAGVGVTILPRLSIIAGTPDVAFVPMADPDACRTVGLVARAGERLSPAADAFMLRVGHVLQGDGDQLRVECLWT